MGTLFIIIIIGIIIYIVKDFNKNKLNEYPIAKREQRMDELVESENDIEDDFGDYEYRIPLVCNEGLVVSRLQRLFHQTITEKDPKCII